MASPNEQVLSAPVRVSTNAATLIMGNTGGGKSSQIATLAEYVRDNYGKVTRIYMADGGGWPGKVEALIRVGVIEVWRMKTRGGTDDASGLTFETIQRATNGYWPAQIKKLSGESPTGCVLLPPVVLRYVSMCPKCGATTKTAPSQSAIGPHACPQCKTQILGAQLIVRKVVQQHPAFVHVGAVVYEGLTSMGNWAMQDIATRQGKGELQGEKSALGGVVRSGELVFGSTNRAHVGFAQNRAQEWVGNSNGIPNLVIPPVWTALTLETTDEGGLSVLGPRLEGRAATDQAPAWFGNCLEAAQTKDEGNGKKQYHLFLSEFIDDNGRRHLIKNRAEPGTLPVKLSDPQLEEDADGYVTNPEVAFSGANLGRFFQLLDEALAKGVASAKAKYGDPTVVDDAVTDWTMGESVAVAAPVVRKPVGAGAVAVAVAAAPVTSSDTPAAPAPAAKKPVIARRPVVKPAKQAAGLAQPTPIAEQAQKAVAEQLAEAVEDITRQTQEAGNVSAVAEAAALQAEPPLPMDPPEGLTSPPLAVAAPASKPGQAKAWASPVRRVPPKPPA